MDNSYFYDVTLTEREGFLWIYIIGTEGVAAIIPQDHTNKTADLVPMLLTLQKQQDRIRNIAQHCGPDVICS